MQIECCIWRDTAEIAGLGGPLQSAPGRRVCCLSGAAAGSLTGLFHRPGGRREGTLQGLCLAGYAPAGTVTCCQFCHNVISNRCANPKPCLDAIQHPEQLSAAAAVAGMCVF